MGFNTTATTNTLIARLTPYGRQRLLVNDINIITKFSIGDSDANYYTDEPLVSGEVPNIGGTLTNGSLPTNSSCNDSEIRNKISVTPSGGKYKNIEPTSYMVTTDTIKLGSTTVSGSLLSQNILDRNLISGSASSITNLFKTFGLPITDINKQYYTTILDANGGYANTSLSGMNQDKVLVIGIPEDKYGEMIDGKSIKVSLTSSGGTYNIYGTYQKSGLTTQQQDNQYKESINSNILNIGNPVTVLFSDEVKRPNGDATKSWGSGYGINKPFTVGGKEFFRNKDNNGLSVTADTIVGMAYLDKGFVVITDPDIVNGFTIGSSVSITFDSIVTEVSQNITCVLDRNEFGVSNNDTFSIGDIVRVTELGLYDDSNRLIAIAKTDKQIDLPSAVFSALSIKIIV